MSGLPTIENPSAMGRMVVCPARWIVACVQATRPSHVVTLSSPDAQPVELGSDEGMLRRLDLRFHDIAQPREGLTAPDEGVVGRLLAFAETWPGDRPLLIACYAGVSRSTAAAYLVAGLRHGPGTEDRLARALRAASPAATPNPLLVSLGDAALGRQGRMVEAISAIGRGAEAFEGVPFVWDLSSGEGQKLALAPSSTAASPTCSTAPSTSPV